MNKLTLLCYAMTIFWFVEESEALCPRQKFYEVQNYTHSGKVLVRKGPWPLKECRR